MGSDLKARLKAKFVRRSSTASAHSESQSTSQPTSQRDEAKSIASADNPSRPASVRLEHHQQQKPPLRSDDGTSPASSSLLNEDDHPPVSAAAAAARDLDTTAAPDRQQATTTTPTSSTDLAPEGNDQRPSTTTTTPTPASHLPSINEDQPLKAGAALQHPHLTSTAEAESSTSPDPDSSADDHIDPRTVLQRADSFQLAAASLPAASASPASSPARPAGPPRRQSLLPHRQTTLIRTLLQATQGIDPDLLNLDPSLLPINPNMVTRKVWVKRASASATLITINEDDLVDDVRDLILRKYANSLGKHFDSPDLTLRLVSREQRNERVLGPEEPMSRTLDAYFPGGQAVEEALIIDIPHRRTPRPSPRAGAPHAIYYAADDGRPSEVGEGYFPPMGAAIPSPNLPVPVPVVAQVNGVTTHTTHTAQAVHGPHSIAVLGTGQIPPIPSPGGTRSRAYRERPDRPRLGRTHTSSPTIINTVAQSAQVAAAAAAAHSTTSFHPRLPTAPSRTHSNTSDQTGLPAVAPAMPSPAAPEPPQVQRTATPPPRVASPRPSASRPKSKKKTIDHPVLPPGMLNGGVPPINVLIVEDNPINLKLLEAFVKRLKVRWKTAMNGKEAVDKWKAGGFHLVLMDIQLPVMNGLQATREIRRLERVNSIGVFSSSADDPPQLTKGELDDKDRLENLELFKSPVIIVALTASSLQSDRHEALAAGCNDFLTKVSSDSVVLNHRTCADFVSL